jgi:hypothetical protein
MESVDINGDESSTIGERPFNKSHLIPLFIHSFIERKKKEQKPILIKFEMLESILTLKSHLHRE